MVFKYFSDATLDYIDFRKYLLKEIIKSRVVQVIGFPHACKYLLNH